jgi:hypothetical protein
MPATGQLTWLAQPSVPVTDRPWLVDGNGKPLYPSDALPDDGPGASDEDLADTILVTPEEMAAEVGELSGDALDALDDLDDESSQDAPASLPDESQTEGGPSMFSFLFRVAKSPLFSWVCVALVFVGQKGLDLAQRPITPPSPAAKALIDSMKGDPRWETTGEALRLSNLALIKPKGIVPTLFGSPVEVSNDEIFTGDDQRHIRAAFDEAYPVIKQREIDARSKELRESLTAAPKK